MPGPRSGHSITTFDRHTPKNSKEATLDTRLGHDEIARILGSLHDPGDDSKVAAIEATGATSDELEEAVAWAQGESDVMGEARRPLTGVVARLYDILTADQFDEDDRD